MGSYQAYHSGGCLTTCPLKIAKVMNRYAEVPLQPLFCSFVISRLPIASPFLPLALKSGKIFQRIVKEKVKSRRICIYE